MTVIALMAVDTATRLAVDYAELDILFGSCIYGTAPCTAQVGVTGDAKCFNTRATCQDPEHFAASTVTLRFGRDTGYLPRSIECIPSLKSVDFSPSTIALGKSLGERSQVTFIFKDHAWADTGPGFDKYRKERPYDPAKQGTFWGKLRARYQALRGRPIRWINGFVGQTLEQMEVRHFIIDSIDGPTEDGTFKIIAKDVLKLADGDRSQTPPLTHGFLSANLAANGTSFGAGFPAGYDASEYPTTAHYVSIGANEIIRVTRSGNTFTVASGGRAQFGTTAVAHSAGDRIQLCRYYEAQPPSAVLSDIFTKDCGVDSSQIPLSDWQDEEGTYLQRQFTKLIAEPTASRQVIDGFIEQVGLNVWSDEMESKIRMQVIRGIPSDAVVFGPGGFPYIKGSLRVSDQPDTRISRCITRFGIRTPLLRPSEPQSFRSVRGLVDVDSEVIYGSAAIREIAGDWIPPLGDTTADRTNELQVGRFSSPPRRFTFEVPRNGRIIPTMGMGARLRAPGILQDAFGNATDTPIQITRVRPGGKAYLVEAEEMLVKIFNPQDVTNRVILINTNNTNLNLLTVHNSLYPPVTAADVANGVNLKVIIAASAKLSATSTSTVPFTVPTGWPPGFPIEVEIWGWVQGAAGRGAHGVFFGDNGNPGLAGGAAMLVRFPINIRFKTGSRLWSGGGGGGSGGHGNPTDSARSGAGGGGAGAPPGVGGNTNGGDGSTTAGGTRGAGTTNGSNIKGRGGNGGNPGLAGDAGQNGQQSVLNAGTGQVTNKPFPGGVGGQPGAQIDGISYVTVLENSGDRRGPTIN